MSRTCRLLLLCCALAGVMACHRSEPAPVSREIPGRRTVQRASMMAERWQLVVCATDPRIQAFAQTLAASGPGEKTLVVTDCANYLPDSPTLILGDHLPPALTDRLPESAFTERLRNPEPGELLLLNNYLNPLTVSDSMPFTVTAYLSPDPDTLLRYLSDLDTQRRGSIFRSRWAYEFHDADGTLTLGTYAEDGWEFAEGEEVYLPAIGPAVLTTGGVDYYTVDTRLPSDRLADVADYVQDELNGNSEVNRVFIYPTAERIGLRRGSMESIQREGSTLHLVVEAAAGDSLRPSANHHPFLAGMTLAHEGYRVYNGYGGSGVGPSLDSLSRLSANAVAIVPYTFMRQANKLDEFPIPDDAGSENDPAVRFAIRQAKGRGMFVLLKPQIWVGGGWPGDVNFTDEAAWKIFFTEYGKWIGHYARMAEEEGVEALCIGTELVQTTLTHPAEWRRMIAAIRSVYRGKLTYAANWGPEFENVTFWGDLDAVGLNSYYPLAQSSKPGDLELQAGASRWMALADSISLAYDRPLWLTEVGYRSVEQAWLNPHAEAGERAASYVDQARCYDALLHAARKSTRLEGMFVWKWPSYLGHREGRGGGDTGYVPGGKPAGELLRAFYSEH